MAQSNANAVVFTDSQSIFHNGDIILHGFCLNASDGSSVKIYDVNDARNKSINNLVFSLVGTGTNVMFSGLEIKCVSGICMEFAGTGTIIIYADRKFKV